MTIDTTNMCSHLQRKLFAPDGEYRAIREQIENDPTLTAITRRHPFGCLLLLLNQDSRIDAVNNRSRIYPR